MNREIFHSIRQWLQQYSALELVYKEYYEKHRDFMPNDQLVERLGGDAGRIELLMTASDKQLPFGPSNPVLLGIWGEREFGVSGEYLKHLSSENLISPLYDVGFMKHPRFCNANRHTHNYYELAYVYAGEASQTIWVEKKSHHMKLREGMFFLIPPTVSHEVSVCDDSILLNLLMRKNTCETALLQNLPPNSPLAGLIQGVLYSKTPSYLAFYTDNAPDLQECLFDLLTENNSNGHYRRELVNLKASILFLNLLSHTGVSIDSYGKNWKEIDYIPTITSFLEANYATVTPQQVADTFNFSRAHLGRLYKKHTGSTLQDMIISIKMNHAVQFLKQSNHPVAEICHMVGYDDVTHFIRRFKAQNGITPHQFRLSYKRG